MSSNAQSHEIRTDIRGLIRLLARNLYTRPDVFLREMIQNAHDAIVRRREIEAEKAPAGTIRLRTFIESGNYTLVIEDNGAGLTENEIHDYLSTIGRSGTDAFRQEMLNKGRYAEAANLIGQFGIGLLSAFVVARQVIVESRSCRPGNPGWRWECAGDKTYTLGGSEALSEPGTRVTLHIDGDHRDMLDPDLLRGAIRRYADFIGIPILLNDLGRINRMEAPWHRLYANEDERLAEYDDFVCRRYSDRPQEIIPIDLKIPFPVQGVLYISDRRPGEMGLSRVDIYQSRMFIVADHPDLLPSWGRFLKGVIDCPAFTPTAARDNIQQDATLRIVQGALESEIINHLKKLAASQPLRFQKIMEWHHHEIKGMALENDIFFQAIADLLPIETNAGLMSLREYLDQTIEDSKGRKTILFFNEITQAAQLFMLANARGVRVINAGYVYEAAFLKKYAEGRSDLVLEPLDFDSSESLFQPLDPQEQLNYRGLTVEFPHAVSDSSVNVRMAHFKPVLVPAVVILSGAEKLHQRLAGLKQNPALPAEIRDMVGRVVREQPQPPVIVYLNADNPTIQLLARMDLRSEAAVNAMGAVFNNARMLAQQVTPATAEKIIDQSNQTVHLLIKKAQENVDLRRQINLVRNTGSENKALTSHISCYFTMDLPSRGVLFEALREILEDAPYGWEVLLSEVPGDCFERYSGSREAYQKAHCFIADISDLAPDIIMELGILLALDRPVLVLCSREAEAFVREHWPMLQRTRYQTYTYGESHEDFRDQLNDILNRQPGFQALRQERHSHYLSPRMLSKAEVQPTVIEAVCREYKTVEEFLEAKPETVAQRISTSRFIILALQEYLKNQI